MKSKLKNKIIKWVSSLLVLTMTITYVPIGEISSVFAESNQTEKNNHTNDSEKKQGKKEIVSKRTENSKTYLDSDGTYSTEISQKPIHFKNNRNEWQPIDNNLISNRSEQVYENKANSFKVKFNKKHTPDSSFIEIEDKQGSAELMLEPLEHTNTEPLTVEGIVNGESITYPNVYPDIDMRYTVGVDRVKEDIIYPEKPSEGFPDKFTYKMELDGMKVKENGGTIYLYDVDSNKPLYYFEAPYMYDSYKPKGFQAVSGIESVPEESISYDIEMEYEVINNELFLHIIPNKKWLEDSNRIYPITIDPTLVKLQSSTYVEDTNIRSAFPSQSGGSDTELGAGRSGTNVIRGLLKFDVSSIPVNSTIMSADVTLWYSSTNNNTPLDISLHRVTKGWLESQANWNYAKTSPSTVWTTKGGDFTSKPQATVGGLAGILDLAVADMKWKLPTTLISDWLYNPQTNYGLLLKSNTENTDSYKKFISSEHTIDSKYHPLLVISYKMDARLGLENHWEFDNHSLVGGNVFTNITTGNNVIQYQDFNLLARGGYDFNFIRTYNSKSLEKSAFGLGWTASGFETLFINKELNTIDYTDEDGTTHTFTYDETSKFYKSGPGHYETIREYSTFTNNRYEYFYEMLDPFGEKFVFKRNRIDNSTSMQVARLEYKEDRHGNRITFEYSNDQLVKISSKLNTNLVKSIIFTYNEAGLIDSAKYEGNELKFRYTDGKLTQVDRLRNDGNYETTKFEYKNNRLIAIVDPNNRRTDFTYQNEMIVKVQEPDIKKTVDTTDRPGNQYSLDVISKNATVIDPEGNKTIYYLNDNYVAERIVADGIETQYELDSNWNITKENVAGSITLNSYDPKGNLLTTTDPEGNTQTYTYTKFCNVKSHTDSDKNTTIYSYNEKGDLIGVEVPVINKEGAMLITIYEYDEYGDIKSVTQPDGSKQLINLDYTSSIKNITNIDVFGNKTSIKTDFKGNVLEKKDGKIQTYTNKYNSKNEIEKIIDPKLHETIYGYDKNGNISSVKNGREFTSFHIYNEQNLLKEEINAIGNKIIYDYDFDGNLTDIYLPNDGIIHYVHDVLNRLTEIHSNGELEWKYNFEGERLASIYQGTNLYKLFDYYDNNKLKSVKEGFNLLEYSYLGDQFKSQLKYSVGGQTPIIIEYVPDEDFRIKGVNKNGQRLVSFQYNSNGLPDLISYVNGSSVSIRYDQNRLSSYRLENKPNQILDEYSLEYDANQNIKKIISNKGITEYSYDELNQLELEKLPDGTIISYEYDEVGNRKKKCTTLNGVITEVNYEYNGANELSKIGSQVYKYDKNGNLNFDGINSYVFNNFNQLIEIKDSKGKTIVRYTYDEEGKRKSSTTSQGTVQYYYEGERVLYETDGNNQVLREYSYDDNGNPVTMTTRGKTYYYLNNHHGDVQALTDSAGNVVASYTYDAWGNILTESGSMASENPYRYAGYRYDDNTKLYYLLTRYYNPDNGVFLSSDPARGELDNPISQNGYNYGNNNPVMNVDPSGTIVETVLDLASIGYSTYQFIKNPTWKTAGYLVWDLTAAAIPIVPGSYVVKGGKLLVNLSKGEEVFLPGFHSFEQARNTAFKILEEYGNVNLWNSIPRTGRLKSSYAYGKVDGRKASDGSWEWRVDWDPHKGAHINIAIGKKRPYKLAIPFKASYKQYKSIIDSYNKKR